MSPPPAARCPSCREVVEPASRCPRCGFALRKLDLQFGVPPRHFGVLSDLTRQLDRSDERELSALLQRFRHRFPQSTLSVFITELSRGSSIGDYAFWLANRVRFSDVGAIGEHNFDLVLVIDTGSGVALTAGYGLETFVAEEELRAALEAGRAAFAAGDWVGGIERCVHELTERLRKIARDARTIAETS